MSSKIETIDLTSEPAVKKAKTEAAAAPATAPVAFVATTVTSSTYTSMSAPAAPVRVAAAPPAHTPTATAVSAAPKAPRAPPKKNQQPHVLIWVCHCGPSQSGKWTGRNLKIVGVYKNKEEAEAKKTQVMNQYEQCGHGDILVGDTCWDEIDLVVRPAEECTL